MSGERFIWCPVANVSREPHSEDGRTWLGIKHFSPGTKLHVYRISWHDGGDRIRVLGRHRGGGNMIEIVIANRWLTDWRVQAIYHPFVVNRMKHEWDDSEGSRLEAEAMVRMFSERKVTA